MSDPILASDGLKGRARERQCRSCAERDRRIAELEKQNAAWAEWAEGRDLELVTICNALTKQADRYRDAIERAVDEWEQPRSRPLTDNELMDIMLELGAALIPQEGS